LNVVGAPLLRFYADHGKIEFDDISTEYKDYLTRGGIAFPGARVGVRDWGSVYGEGYTRGGKPVLRGVVKPGKSSVSLKSRGGVVFPAVKTVKPKRKQRPTSQ